MPKQSKVSAKSKSIKPYYQIKAMGGGAAEVLIYGDIGDIWWDEESITAKNFVEELNALDAKTIDVRVNSYGGVVADGIAIFNALRRHSAHINTYIDGVAYSIASLIVMAGDEVYMADNALLMIHAPWGFASGNAEELRRQADTLDKYADAMTQSYVRDGGPSKDEINALLKDGDDHYFTAIEAQEMGLVDETTESLDIAAALRGFDLGRFNQPAAVVAILKEKTEMPVNSKSPVAKKTSANGPENNVTEIEAKARENRDKELKARNKNVIAFLKPHMQIKGMSELKDEILSDPAMTEAQAREKAMDLIGEGYESINKPGAQVAAGTDESEKRILAMTDSILSRVGVADQDRGNPFRGMRLSDIAKACLENEGTSVRGMHVEEFAPLALSSVRAAQTTSDFPVILENVMHKLVLLGFADQPVTWDRIAKVGDVTDLRDWKRIVPGLLGNLDGVDEHGAYKDKKLPDGEANSIAAVRRGNIISITPEVLINDDLGYIQAMASGLGRVGNRTLERAFYALLESNPVLSDSKALFHADHGNLASSGAVPSETTLDAAAVAMAGQTAPGDDAEYLDITPRVALVNTGKRGDMNVIVTSPFSPDSTNKLQRPNKVQGVVEEIVATPRISALPWYLFADPNIAPVIEVVFLNGQRAPRLVQEENFRTSGMSWKVEFPFGVGAIDYRGAWKNPGS